jgi:hypothetical protein
MLRIFIIVLNYPLQKTSIQTEDYCRLLQQLSISYSSLLHIKTQGRTNLFSKNID